MRNVYIGPVDGELSNLTAIDKKQRAHPRETGPCRPDLNTVAGIPLELNLRTESHTLRESLTPPDLLKMCVLGSAESSLNKRIDLGTQNITS